MAYLPPPIALAISDKSSTIPLGVGRVIGALWERNPLGPEFIGGRGVIVGGGTPPSEGQLWPRGDGSAP